MLTVEFIAPTPNEIKAQHLVESLLKQQAMRELSLSTGGRSTLLHGGFDLDPYYKVAQAVANTDSGRGFRNATMFVTQGATPVKIVDMLTDTESDWESVGKNGLVDYLYPSYN